MSPERTVLFHRDVRRHQGGHQKVLDYFEHLLATDGYRPFVSFAPTTSWDASNVWGGYRDGAVPWEPDAYELLFLGGLDWRQVPASCPTPVINLIQGTRHAAPGSALHGFLSRQAIRICVSPEVADAINATGLVNGSVFVNPNGLAVPEVTAPIEHDVFVLGPKNPHLAVELRNRLEAVGTDVVATTERLPRREVLRNMASARVAVLLPKRAEGFYLPALEAFRLGGLTVVPDCVGNRSFCHDGVNCLMPDYTADEILSAARTALAVAVDAGPAYRQFREAALQTADRHSLEAERSRFQHILAEAGGELWGPNR